MRIRVENDDNDDKDYIEIKCSDHLDIWGMGEQLEKILYWMGYHQDSIKDLFHQEEEET